ncbi:MAG: hypothetical protein IK005_12040 [Paludibacteraceae bacterium]|nr:hypothetical protein [Paludibacteraceae bacterium]
MIIFPENYLFPWTFSIFKSMTSISVDSRQRLRICRPDRAGEARRAEEGEVFCQDCLKHSELHEI